MAKTLSGIFLLVILLLAKGVHGGYRFQWQASLALQEQYDDNVNLSPTNEEESYITTITPGGRLILESKTGALNLDYRLNAIFYESDNDRNYLGHQATLDVNQTLWRNFTIRFTDRFVRSDEQREERITADAGGPTDYYPGTRTVRSVYIRNTASPSIELRYGSDDLVRLGYENTLYQNEDETVEDSQRHAYTLSIEHWFGPEYGLVVDLGYQMNRFETSPDFDGQDAALTFTKRFDSRTSAFITGSSSGRSFEEEEGNDYRTYSGGIGINHALSPNLSGRIRAGYFYQDPERGDPEEGFDGELSLTSRWIRIQGTLFLRGGYDESFIDAENLGFSRFWSAGANLRYQATRKISLGIGGSSRIEDFSTGRNQVTWDSRADLAMTILKWLSASLDFLHQERDSDDDSFDYTDNRLTLSLTATYL